jgi:hypothetical protein
VQLELSRRPDLISELGKRRGPKLVEADWPELAQRPPDKGNRAPVSAWAAFSFSGSLPPCSPHWVFPSLLPSLGVSDFLFAGLAGRFRCGGGCCRGG